MKNLAEISDDEIRGAEWINAVDANSVHWETVWGLDEFPPADVRQNINILDVALDESDLPGLLKLIDRIEQLRGRLSPRVQALRQTLKLASSGPPVPGE